MEEKKGIKTLELISELLETLSELMIRFSEIEKKGLPLTRLSDKSFLQNLMKEIYDKLSKEQFITLMGIFYGIGKVSTIDLTKLSPDDRIKLGKELKELSQQMRDFLKGLENAETS